MAASTGAPPQLQGDNPPAHSGRSNGWTRPKPSDKAYKEVKEEFDKILIAKENVGVAIILGIVNRYGPQGTDLDVELIKATFESLKFGVYVIKNPDIDKIAAVIEVARTAIYPISYQFIVMYYAGHGGSEDGKGYVIPCGDNDPRFYIDEGIVFPFQPSQAPNLSDRYRLFFFDCCLKTSSKAGEVPVMQRSDPTRPPKQPSFLPPRGQCIIAYATSLEAASSGNYISGGIWTKKLCNNLRYDVPISTVLDMTWSDVVTETRQKLGKKIQGPHYVSSVGSLFLRDPYQRERDVILKHFGNPAPMAVVNPIPTVQQRPRKGGTDNVIDKKEGRVYENLDRPCPGHVFEAFTNQGIADKWREIGGKLEKNILDPNKLKMIMGDSATAIQLMLSKCTNLKWFHLIGAVRNSCGEDKADGIAKFLAIPHSCSKC